MTDLYIGFRQQNLAQSGDSYAPDSTHYYNESGTEVWDSETNTLSDTGTDYTLLFEVGDLVFNVDFNYPHTFVKEVTATSVTFTSALPGFNESGFSQKEFDGGDITDPANFSDIQALIVAYRAARQDEAYLLQFDGTGSGVTTGSNFDLTLGAPDYICGWYEGAGYSPGQNVPYYRVVEVVSADTVKVDRPIFFEDGNGFFWGNDGVTNRYDIDAFRWMNFYYGISYGTFDVDLHLKTRDDYNWLEPWDAYQYSTQNATEEQAKLRIEEMVDRIENLCQGNYSNNFVMLSDVPGAYLG